MILVAIPGFLIGALPAFGFPGLDSASRRVAGVFAKTIFELIVGTGFLPAIGVGLVIGPVPQFVLSACSRAARLSSYDCLAEPRPACSGNSAPSKAFNPRAQAAPLIFWLASERLAWRFLCAITT